LNTIQRYNFSPPCLCGKVVPYLHLFLKNKKIQKSSGGPPCHIGKMMKSCIFR
jgi:hypothetical protein